MLNFCYTLEYDDFKFTEPMLSNIKVYAVAAYYDLSSLQTIAATKSKKAATPGSLHSADFLKSVALIYERLFHDKSLRDIVIDLTIDHSKTALDASLEGVVSPTLKELMDGSLELSKDFALALLPGRTKFAKFRKFKCPDSTCNDVWADKTKPMNFALRPG